MLRASRLLFSFVRGGSPVAEREIDLAGPGGVIPATLMRPPGGKPTRGWVLLQGITALGRHHPSIVRFARALCGSGATVLVPEIASWTALHLRPRELTASIGASAAYLRELPEVEEGGVSVVGFSFGATQALVAAAEPRVRRQLRTLVAWGGYCDLDRVAAFMMTGEHDWAGERYRADPDAYGRWIVAANYLTSVPGLEHAASVSAGLFRLARVSGREGFHRPESFLDPLKAEIRAGLSAAQRELWDLLAPPAGQLPRDRAAALELSAALSRSALEAEPSLDPRPVLAAVEARVVLAHGSTDRLIPFTETLRLAAALPPAARHVCITRLFDHSAGSARVRPAAFGAETWRLLRHLHQALR